MLGLLLTLLDFVFTGLFFSLFSVFLGLFSGFIGSLGRVFTPLVAEVTLFLLFLLGLLDGVLLGNFLDACQLALVFLLLLDAVLDLLLTLAFSLFFGLGLAFELLEVLLLGPLLCLEFLLAQGLGRGGRLGRSAAVVAGLDFLALGFLTGFLFGFESCELFHCRFLFGLFQSLGLGVKTCLLSGLAFHLLGLDACLFAFGGSFLLGLFHGFLFGFVEFFLLEVAVFLIVLLLQVVEVVLKGAALVQQQVEVVHADDDIVNLAGNPDGLVLLKQGAVVGRFLEVVQALDNEQAQ